jgi:hypothetical protein
MRLNFAGMPEDQIREGVRRIGSAMRAQLALFGSLTGRRGRGAAAPGQPASGSPGPASPGTDPGAGLADVVALPRRGDRGAGRRSSSGET